MSYRIITSDVRIASNDKLTAEEMIRIYEDFKEEVLSRLKRINPSTRRKVLPIVYTYEINPNKYNYIFSILTKCLTNNKIRIFHDNTINNERELDLAVDKLSVVYQSLKKFIKQIRKCKINIYKSNNVFIFKIVIHKKDFNMFSIIVNSGMPDEQIKNIISLSFM